MFSRVTAAVARVGRVHVASRARAAGAACAPRAAAALPTAHATPAVAATAARAFSVKLATPLRNPGSSDDSGTYYSSVFVSNLPFDAGRKEIREFFEQAGPVQTLDLFTRNGVPTGSGVVEYLDSEAALKACGELCDRELNGRPVLVRENNKPTHRKNYQLQLRHLPSGTGWWDVKDLVRKFVEVLHVKTQGNRALIQVGNDADLEALCEELNRRTIYGSKLHCTINAQDAGSRSGFSSVQRHQVLVRNLPKYVGWQEVKDMFKEFGECEHVVVKNNMAVVRMAFDEDADSAIQALNGASMFGHTVEVMKRRA